MCASRAHAARRSPSAYDRVLATQFGSYAAKLVEIERYGVTVAMVNRHVTQNRLADIAGKTRNVPENCDLLTVARRMGISLVDYHLNALRFALSIFSGIIIFYWGFLKICGFSGIPFSPEGSQPADASNKRNAVFRCTPSRENADPGRP